ncbi:phage tail tape measure protein [Risungbinella massiliensis]|uniref:hypothetical protein n=1 Tax=Risungbinella massiliensis TaxID=1329796 RepID=UPI0005CB96B9|nr:hypothetical protein [Risungbinella massiliensis]
MANTVELIINGIDRASSVFKKVAASAEKAMNEVKGTIQNVNKQLDKLNNSKVIVTVKANTGKAITQLRAVREQMDDLARRGREVGEGMVDFAENVTQGLTVPLALVGGLAFKAAADSGHMMAILSARLGGVRSEIEKVAPIAQRVFRDGLGKDVEEVASVVGVARQKFKQLSDIQLDSLVTNVLAISKALGVDAMDSLEQVIEIMNKYKLSSTQALDLVAAGYKATDLEGKKLSKTLTEVKGRADAVRNAIMSSPYTQLISQWRQLQEALVPIGSKLLELANQYLPMVIEKVQQFGQWFASLSGSTQTLLIALTALVAILPLVAMFIGSIMLVVNGLIPVFTFLGTTAGLITLGILALVAACLYFWETSTAFREAITSVALAFWDLLVAIGQFLVKVYEVVTNGFTILKNNTIAIWDNIKVAISGVLNILLGLFRTFSSLLRGDWQGVWNGIKTITKGAIQLVKGVIMAGLNAALVIVVGILMAMDNVIKSVWNGIKSATLSAWNAIKSLISNAISSALSAVKGYASSFLSAGKGLLNALVSGIKSGISNAIAAVKNGMAQIRSYLPFSPAKEGPLSDLDKSGESFFPTFASRMDKGLRPALRTVSSGMGETRELLNTPKIPTTMGSGSVVQNFYIQATIREEADIVKLAENLKRLQNIEQRAGGMQFGY